MSEPIQIKLTSGLTVEISSSPIANIISGDGQIYAHGHYCGCNDNCRGCPRCIWMRFKDLKNSLSPSKLQYLGKKIDYSPTPTPASSPAISSPIADRTAREIIKPKQIYYSGHYVGCTSDCEGCVRCNKKIGKLCSQ